MRRLESLRERPLIALITKGISNCVVSIHSVLRSGTQLAMSEVYPAREYKEFRRYLRREKT